MNYELKKIRDIAKTIKHTHKDYIEQRKELIRETAPNILEEREKAIEKEMVIALNSLNKKFKEYIKDYKDKVTLKLKNTAAFTKDFESTLETIKNKKMSENEINALRYKYANDPISKNMLAETFNKKRDMETAALFYDPKNDIINDLNRLEKRMDACCNIRNFNKSITGLPSFLEAEANKIIDISEND